MRRLGANALEATSRPYDTLESLHLAEDAILLITSDHGCHFKTRNEEYKF